MSQDSANPAGPIGETTTDALADAVAVLVADGLPVDEGEAPQLLLNLRSVYARSVVPAQPRSRLQALNELLPRLISGMSDPVYRDAVQTLFGLAPGTRGTKLMARRRQAATILGYSAAYLRTDIEPKLIRAVASAIHDDLLRYAARVERSAESTEPTGDTPHLGPEHLNHEEELVSRIWQHVYGLRAETIAVLRLTERAGFEMQLEESRQAMLVEEARLKVVIQEYIDTYGRQLVRHGDIEFAVDALTRIGNWTL
jgi:hypothetical protein